MIGIRYHAAAFDGSGYAVAARGYLQALHRAGFLVQLHAISYDQSKPDLGGEGVFLRKLERADVEYDVNIIHLTPEHYPLLREDGKLNIGHFAWETDRLPKSWIEYIDHVDVVFTSCQWNKAIIQKDRPDKPVFVIPHGLDVALFRDAAVTPFSRVDDKFVFFSAFQWNERKNGAALLRAFWTEFAGQKDVALVLKTYVKNHGPKESEQLGQLIEALKKGMGADRKRPDVHLMCSVLPARTMAGLYKLADVYVLATRGEGFGLPFAEAMAAGTPSIATAFGGQFDFLTQKNAWLVDSRLTPVIGMVGSPWYQPWQRWADPCLLSLMTCMREAYEDRALTARKGEQAAQDSVHMSWDAVGETYGRILCELAADRRL